MSVDCGWKIDRFWEERPAVEVDLDEIVSRGKLIVITGFNPLSYFIYKGQPMGYDYELLEMFADQLGVKLELLVAHDPDSIYHMLNKGMGDVVAFGQAVTKEGAKAAAFTEPHMEVHQVLVQRKPEGWREMSGKELDNRLIREPEELAGMRVHVHARTAHFERILDLAEEIGYEIDVVPVTGDISTDDLIGMVAEGEINYTIADENVALLNSTYYPDIDVTTEISKAQGLAWAVRKNSPRLLQALDDWLNKVKRGREYNMVYKKYFKSRKNIAAWAASDYFSEGGGKISKYDNLIRRYARDIGWDWRLLSALIYEESRFHADTCSWAGAQGLMQLMTTTGLQYGATDLADPQQNLFAGTSYLKYLEYFWKEIPDSSERMKFVLASYNAGESHVKDAARLAEKYAADPCVWEGNVAVYLANKSKPKYYNDPVVVSGYCRGESVVNYVRKVVERYGHYTRMIEDLPSDEISERRLLRVSP